jgi:tetratricopeptide (TPR) repeat protein
VQRERNGESVVDAALAWLGQNHTRPFFCWVHLFDPHAPYRAHADLFGEEFADRPYDAEIAYADRQVERLLDFLKLQGLESQTLVVVVADHGEGLGEHVERTHSATLYNATMHVPLIFRHSGRLSAGRRVSSNLSIVDLFPTILELLGAAGPRQMTGRSFKAALSGRPVESSRCYGATDEPLLRSGWSPLRSILDGSWKYIRTARPELYDLASDPHERNNLAEARPDRTRAMEALLAEFESRLVARGGVPVQLSAAERRALASLGYVGSATAAPAGPPANLADIKDMLPFDNAVEDAGELMKKGSLDGAIPRLREVIREAPDHTEAHLYLANAFLQKSEYDQAIDTLLGLIAKRPNCRDAHFDLGVALLERGQPDVAAHEFETALEIDPELADAHVNLAKVLFSAGRMEDALAHLNAALQTDRGHGAAYQWRARLLAMQGQIDAALADYRTALKCSPRSPEAHYNLGALLAEYGDAGEAREHLTRAVELEPASAEFHYALGAFLARRGQFDEAVAHLTKALELRPGYGAAAEGLRAARQSQKAQRPDAK